MLFNGKKEATWVLSDLNSDTMPIADKFGSNINTLGPLANVGWARCDNIVMTLLTSIEEKQKS